MYKFYKRFKKIWVEKIDLALHDNILAPEIKKEIKIVKDLNLVIDNLIVNVEEVKVSSAVNKYIDFYCELEIQK